MVNLRGCVFLIKYFFYVSVWELKKNYTSNFPAFCDCIGRTAWQRVYRGIFLQAFPTKSSRPLFGGPSARTLALAFPSQPDIASLLVLSFLFFLYRRIFCRFVALAWFISSVKKGPFPNYGMRKNYHAAGFVRLSLEKLGPSAMRENVTEK